MKSVFVPVASDNSGTVSVTNDSPSQFPVGVTVVTRTTSDPSRNTVACAQTVTVMVSDPPTLDCPTNIVTEFTSASGALVTFAAAAKENCSGDFVVICAPASGSTFAVGTTVVTCTATGGSGNAASCSFRVTVLGARGVQENVLAELIALRASFTKPEDRGRLDEAVARLTASLAASLWVDERHVDEKHGHKVFQEDKEAVRRLQELAPSQKNNLPPEAIESVFDRIVGASRLLAMVSVQETAPAGAKPNKVAEAVKNLEKGDGEAAKGNLDRAIERYGQAWK